MLIFPQGDAATRRCGDHVEHLLQCGELSEIWWTGCASIVMHTGVNVHEFHAGLDLGAATEMRHVLIRSVSRNGRTIEAGCGKVSKEAASQVSTEVCYVIVEKQHAFRRGGSTPQIRCTVGAVATKSLSREHNKAHDQIPYEIPYDMPNETPNDVAALCATLNRSTQGTGGSLQNSPLQTDQPIAHSAPTTPAMLQV